MNLIPRKRPASAPSILYKFYGPERASVFKDMLVRFSQPSALNDPFEYALAFPEGKITEAFLPLTRGFTNPLTLIKFTLFAAYIPFKNQEIRKRPLIAKLRLSLLAFFVVFVGGIIFHKKLKNSAGAIDRRLAEVMEDFIKEAKEGLVLIFSCSATWKSVPMWAHYAANHRGFVIGIDPNVAFPNRLYDEKKFKDEFLAPMAVRYGDYSNRAPDYNKHGREAGQWPKSEHWSYEKEWRFGSTVDGAAQRGEFREGSEVALFALNPGSVKEVIFGLDCEADHLSRMMRDCDECQIAPEYFKIVRGEKFSFERMLLTDSTDVVATMEPVRDKPLPGIVERPVPKVDALLESIKADWSNHFAVRWVRNWASKRNRADR